MTRPLIFRFLLPGLILLELNCCKNNQSLDFKISDLKTVDRVDTIDIIPDQQVYILGLYRHLPLGHFTYDLGLLKQLKDGNQVFYEAHINPNILRISSAYLAFVDYAHGFHNVGWYYVKNNQLQDSLVGFQKIGDSISTTFPIGTYIDITKNCITVYLNSQPKKRFYYEEFALNNKGDSLETLNYGLYILEKGDLKKVSDNGEDIYKKTEGTFYIPAPGLGITAKWEKSKLLKILDSVSSQRNPISNFSINQSN